MAIVNIVRIIVTTLAGAGTSVGGEIMVSRA